MPRYRRRFLWRPAISAFILAAVFLVVLIHLHRRLSFFSSHPQQPHQLPYAHSISYHPLLDDLDSDPITSFKPNDDRIDVRDDVGLDNENNEEVFPEEEEEDATQNRNPAVTSSYFFDPVHGVVRRSFSRRSIEEWEDYVPFNVKLESDIGFGNDRIDPFFGSDDTLVDDRLRAKLNEVRRVEDALLLKGSVLRRGWGEWFDKKADFMRRDPLFKPNMETMNPANNPILQDPDGIGLSGLTRGDKMYLRGIMDELKKSTFFVKKPLSVSSSESGKQISKEVRIAKRALSNAGTRKVKVAEKDIFADGDRWGYYPGLRRNLPFETFMDEFFRRERCTMRVFMVWNSSPWMFGVRHQRGLESLLYHHWDACVVVFSETMELNFFGGFVNDGYKVAVVMPNLDDFLKDTPTEVFASLWMEWRKTKHYPIHFSELIRLVSLYKYGGIYLDSDVIVLKPLSSLNNSIAYEDEHEGVTLNGAVMAFRKHSPFIMHCLSEFYATYNDTELRWNGADLMTRAAKNFTGNRSISDMKMELDIQPSSLFFPISRHDISRYFTAEVDKDGIINEILNSSVTFHFWNGLTTALVPEAESLVYKLLNQYCIYCSDTL